MNPVWPCVALPLCVFAIVTSGDGPSAIVDAVAVIGLVVAFDAVTEWEIVEPGVTPLETFTTMGKLEVPTASDVASQVMALVPPTAGVMHVHPGAGVKLTKVVPVGTAVLRCAVESPLAPMLVAAIAYERFCPIVTVAGAESVRFMGPTRVEALAELLPVSGSAVVALMDTELTMTEAVVAPFDTWSVIEWVWLPVVTVARLQLMDPVPPLAGVMHVQPGAGDMETKVVLAGIVSLHATPVAEFGPLLVVVKV